MSIRYCLDAYDEYSMFGDIPNFDPHTDESLAHPHVRLGSLDKTIHFSSYAKKLSKDIGLHDLQEVLTTFLRLNRIINATNDTISNFEVWMAQPWDLSCAFAEYTMQVVPCHALQVTYDCQETAVKKTDLLHVTTSWRGSGERYDSAILQGSGPLELVFCQICAIFMISIAQEWHRLAVVRTYEWR